MVNLLRFQQTPSGNKFNLNLISKNFISLNYPQVGKFRDNLGNYINSHLA